jgi:hypothetical protein
MNEIRSTASRPDNLSPPRSTAFLLEHQDRLADPPPNGGSSSAGAKNTDRPSRRTGPGFYRVKATLADR